MKYVQHVAYFLYWLIFFVVSKAVFVIYHHTKTATLTLSEIAGIFIHGLYLDSSFCAYVCTIPFFLFFLQSLFKNVKIGRIITIYTILLVIVMNLLTVADLELYKVWGFRLDASLLQYLHTPVEMIASAGASPLVLLLLIYLLLNVFFTWCFLKFFRKFISMPVQQVRILPAFFSLLLLLFLFVPMRGGFQQIPINQSDVYFSGKMFANHSAVNVPWNLMRSLVRVRFDNNPYGYFSDQVAHRNLSSLYPHGREVPRSIVTKPRPNIIFIILESYTSKFVGVLGGDTGVTPNLDNIAREGMLFTQIYAAADRSEKGLVAILSGYPTQAVTSIIKTPAKTESLPHLNQALESEGYHSSYFYGGELAFANIKSYLLNAGYDRLVSKYDFEKKDYNSKWGVHDHVLLNRFIVDLATEKQPFFSTLFTLSSHEPYEIPVQSKFPGSDETSLFKNSCYYTDLAIGDFFKQAKKQPWWDSTLIIITADHGHRLPGNDPIDRPSKFKIPLILTGGALKVRNHVNNTIGSQTDIAYTILQQLGIDAGSFKWSKNLLDTSRDQFACYIFNNGFGMVTKAGAVTFDNVSKKVIYRDEGVPAGQLDKGKAYMQLSFADFLKR